MNKNNKPDYSNFILPRFEEKARPCKSLWHRLFSWKRLNVVYESHCQGDDRTETFICKKCDVTFQGVTQDAGPTSPDSYPLAYWRIIPNDHPEALRKSDYTHRPIN